MRPDLTNSGAPTRRAYTFLAELDFDGPIPPSPSVSPATGGSVSLVRLTSFWQHLLDRLARLSAAAEPTALHESVRSASQNIERYLQDEGASLPPTSRRSRRAIRGWLAFFAERENLDAYIAALRLAAPILEAGVRAQAGSCHPCSSISAACRGCTACAAIATAHVWRCPRR
jgi:hypothetical protein